MEKVWLKLKNGLKKYCDDNGFDDVVLGLSGGLDSAVTAVLACDALGKKHVHGVMMATKFTSPLSLQIARKIAEMNGFDFTETDIQPLVDVHETFLKHLWKNPPKNITLENLQARLRGQLLMAYANQYNYLLLACGNKSEIAMGYCTLYGDTCGGLAPIGDVYKSDIFELAKWRNGINPVLPMEVIVRAPSAELAANQKDEDSLPPYALLDKILKAYIDEKQTPAQLAADGFDAVTVEEVIRRYHAQAFKRRQMAQILSSRP